MSNCVTSNLQTDIKSFMTSCESLINEAPAIYNLYWKSGASSDLSSLADGDAATVSTKLTKGELTTGLAFVEQLDNFFQNSAVTQSDYLGSLYPIYYGNNEASAVVSTAVEAMGSRLYDLTSMCLELLNQGKTIEAEYNANEISDCVAVWEDERIVYGSEMTKVELSSAITLIQQFMKVLENQAVTAGDYESTVRQWGRL